MLALLARLGRDEAGFIVSAELVLIGSITVLTMVVGLAEVSYAVNSELTDCAAAFDSVNQSYTYDDGGQNYWSYQEDDGLTRTADVGLGGGGSEN